MTLRLDTYPEAQIATQMIPQNPPMATPTLCCLLHTGPVPPAQQIEVWIEGTQQIPQQEGTQQVFSWTCARQSEMSIQLKQYRRLVKSWRGWWQGETTIAHTGTLQIQVFCAGVLQPAGLPHTGAMPVGVAAKSADQHNGSHHDGIAAVATWEAVTAPTSVAPSVTEGISAEDDDLWGQACQEAFPGVTEEVEAVPHQEQEACEEPAGQDAMEADGKEIPQEQIVETPVATSMQRERQEHPTWETDAAAVAAPAGTMLASFPATTVWSQTAQQEQEERLTAVLATMPANTILVDLRQHTPPPRRGLHSSKVYGPQKLGLSKALLRNQYGGRYWDRGATIQTARHLLSTPPPTWGRVVTNPDDRDGLGTLITALTHGFSLVILDGEPKYAESVRAAVLAELRQHVANLTIGSCS